MTRRARTPDPCTDSEDRLPRQNIVVCTGPPRSERRLCIALTAHGDVQNDENRRGRLGRGCPRTRGPRRRVAIPKVPIGGTQKGRTE
jgi:hypothetical protein